MRILELDIRHFGKFENTQLRFNPGINIIYGGNETGKSTVHAFIRAMFFGISRSRGRMGQPDEYELRQPWENGAWFEGSLRFESEGKVYRIDRNFHHADRRLTLVCESESRQSIRPQEELQELLAGMGEEAFRSTIFISQADAAAPGGLLRELKNYMVSVQESGDGSLDVGKALELLRSRRKKLQQEKENSMQLLEEQIGRKQLEEEYLRRECRRLEDQLPPAPKTGLSKTPGSSDGTMEEKNHDELPDRAAGKNGQGWQEADTTGMYRRIIAGFCVLIFLLSVGCAVMAEGIWLKLLMVSIGLLSVVLFLLFFLHPGKSFTDTSGEKAARPDTCEGKSIAEQTAQEYSPMEQASARLLHQSLHEKQVMLENVRSQLLRLQQEEDRLGQYDEEIEAVDLAALRIRELSSRIYVEMGQDFTRRSGEILEQLTEGRYTAIGIDEKQQVRINTPSKLLYLSQISCGSMQQVWFALRLAAGELLGGTDLPLIFDEPFSMYDEDRLRMAMRFLQQQRRQVILFTCQTREKQILDQLRI